MNDDHPVRKWRAAGQRHPAAPDKTRTDNRAGQTLVIVTHDSRIAATADRLISMRDGAFTGETRLSGGASGSLRRLAGLETRPGRGWSPSCSAR